jgi:AraC family transcriptional regulator of adaptative response/methylated-DNA-[protein]-cysteine methyltransferase
MERDYHRISAAIRFLLDHAGQQPGIGELSAFLKVSRWHLTRLFRRWAGLTPDQFVAFVTVTRARGLLVAGRDVLGAALDLGLSGPSRLHDRCVTIAAFSPGELARGGGLRVQWGAGPTPFGTAIVAWNQRGVCGLEFLAEPADASEAYRRMARQWPASTGSRNDAAAAALLRRVFVQPWRRQRPFHLQVQGTPFQIAVWKALLAVPPGTRVSYQHLAKAVGRPTANRAVGGAVGANPIAWLIPCHRVIRASGLIGQYRWGEERKLAMTLKETCQGARK